MIFTEQMKIERPGRGLIRHTRPPISIRASIEKFDRRLPNDDDDKDKDN